MLIILLKIYEQVKVDITSQNHGYSIDRDSLKDTDLEVTHIALNDGTVEGLRHKQLPAFSVQYHPEQDRDQSDSNYLFDEFITMMNEFKERGASFKCLNAMIFKQF